MPIASEWIRAGVFERPQPLLARFRLGPSDTHFFACGVWEAVYVLDGPRKNTSDIQPDTAHSDTQGQSAPVFDLSHMLGIELMSRIRNLKELTFFRPNSEAAYEHIDSLFTSTTAWKPIETHR